jgi:hypothetical protein
LTIPVLGNRAILSKLSSHVELATIVQMVLSVTTILITTSIFVAPDMPSCLPQAFSIVFDDVQFHADGRIVGLDVAVTRGRTALRGNGVEIVVDASLSSAHVHVKLNITTKQVPRGSAMDASFTINSPSVAFT